MSANLEKKIIVQDSTGKKYICNSNYLNYSDIYFTVVLFQIVKIDRETVHAQLLL